MAARRSPSNTPFNNPFIEALGKTSGERGVPAPAESIPERAVLRYERKGRGGKEVTVIDGLALAPEQLAGWLRELKSAFGCGGTVEREALVLQGNQLSRAREWLLSRGVRKVSG